MESALRITLIITAFISLFYGMNLLYNGINNFISPDTEKHKLLDNHFRFLSAMFFSMGFLIAWISFDLHQQHETVYLIGLIVFFAGIGRLYSTIKVGSAGKRFIRMMVLEMILGVTMILLEYLR